MMKPGESFGTTNAAIPLAPSDLSVVANTVTYSDVAPPVQEIFVPLMIHEPPSRIAVVDTWEVSQPKSGSVKANAVRLLHSMTGVYPMPLSLS